MKIYFAGIGGNVNRLNYLQEFGASRLMLTYADKKLYSKNMQRFKDRNFEILLDSGAFSVWKRGYSIKLEEYQEYIKINSIDSYINLDSIGNAEVTLDNQKQMEFSGFSPIPVFHLGSDFLYLQNLVNLNYNYICLGGSVGKKKREKIEFFKKCFDLYPHIKYHGLGVTDTSIIKMFPFFSVDSTTWLVGDKNGKILDKEGRQITAPKDMTSREKFANIISYFVDLERQLS